MMPHRSKRTAALWDMCLIIDTNPRSKARKEELEAEAKRRKAANYTLAEDRRYNERSTVERVNGRIKDEFGARMRTGTRARQSHGAFDVRHRGADRRSVDEVYRMTGSTHQMHHEKHVETACYESPCAKFALPAVI